MAGKEKNCKWHFADQPNGQEVGPNNAMEQNFKTNPYASLVRESIQNSLDAVLDPYEPVVVKFSFMEMNRSDYPEFFELRSHIEGCLKYFPNNYNAKMTYGPMLKIIDNQSAGDKIGFIRVSDYNTKGMTYEEGNTDSPFYAFVRSAGVTVKDNTSTGGSYGFGKAAYYLVSPISTIIVSTCTEDYDKYFEGASSLCTHLYRGSKKMAFGYYDDNNGKPIKDETNIPAKFRRSEPGTDINIIGFDFLDRDDAIKSITEAVLRNFWMAIYNNRLSVVIDDHTIINSRNIAEILESTFPEEDDNTKKSNYHNPRPYFNALRFANSSNKYLSFEETLPLLGKVRFYVYKKKGAPDKITYLRAPQMLVFCKRNKSNNGFYGVFHCISEKGNEVLRNMENPAHNEWKQTNWRINGKVCPEGKAVSNELEDFIKECISSAFSLNSSSHIDIKGLEEFLYIPSSYDDIEDEFDGADTGTDSEDTQDEGGSLKSNLEDHGTPESNDDLGNSGHVMVNKVSKAKEGSGGTRSGHGKGKRTSRKPFVKPGDIKTPQNDDPEGKEGLYAIPITLAYRSFTQTIDGNVYHYIILHSESKISDARIQFLSVGDDGEDVLTISESSKGIIQGNSISKVEINEGTNRIRVRFTDNMRHSLKLSAEAYEV